MFRITGGKGFNMVFGNGVAASVQFGFGNYCDHHDMKVDDYMAFAKAPNGGNFHESGTAEVAAWIEGTTRIKGKMRTWITQELYPDAGDDVMGYLSADQVLEFLNKAAAYKVAVKQEG